MTNVADFSRERELREAIEAADEMGPVVAEFDDVVEEVAPERSASPLLGQWMRFREAFAEAMEGGPYRIEDLERQVLSGEVYLWPGKASAIVAKRVVYPSGESTLETLWAVGDVAEVLQLAPGMEATARLLGCTAVHVEGRAGWAKVLKPHGYKPWSVTVRKDLD